MLAGVKDFRDLEVPILRSVEELIDFRHRRRRLTPWVAMSRIRIGRSQWCCDLADWPA